MYKTLKEGIFKLVEGCGCCSLHNFTSQFYFWIVFLNYFSKSCFIIYKFCRKFLLFFAINGELKSHFPRDIFTLFNLHNNLVTNIRHFLTYGAYNFKILTPSTNYANSFIQYKICIRFRTIFTNNSGHCGILLTYYLTRKWCFIYCIYMKFYM